MDGSWLGATLVLCLLSGAGCMSFEDAARDAPGDVPRDLVEQLVASGGRVSFHDGGRFGRSAEQVKMLYIPRATLSAFPPSSLTGYPNLKGLMIIEPADGDRPERALTGCLVDGAEDLAALEDAYRREGWIVDP